MLALVAAVVVVDVGTAVAAELVAMSATDANDNDGRTVAVVDDGVNVDDDVAVAAADNPSYPASAISPLSTI